MISKLLIIFISILSITQCKENSLNKNCNLNCYKIENNYVVLNFHNNTNRNIKLPMLTSIIDDDFYILQNYYDIENDTLFIKMTNENLIYISHKNSNTKIQVKNDRILLEKGKSTQQLFKINEKFRYIVLEPNMVFIKCK